MSTSIETPSGHVPGIERHIVLISPDIHWNTGNTGRTCLAVGAHLHLVKPLGFSLESAQLKRAGLDYWPKVKLTVWLSFADLLQKMDCCAQELVLLTKNGVRDVWSMPRRRRLFLVLGSETRGLPQSLLSEYRQHTYFIPTNADIRSLNLSTAAAIALYESLRLTPFSHFWRPQPDPNTPLDP